MKLRKCYLSIILLFLANFLFADNAKLNSENKKKLIDRTDFTKLKKSNFFKPKELNDISNDNLKTELEKLENDFNKEHKFVKIKYKRKITLLKEQQKTEVKSIKKGYSNRRREIYKKYGVSPPKKVNKNKNNAPLKLKKKHKNLPKTK